MIDLMQKDFFPKGSKVLYAHLWARIDVLDAQNAGSFLTLCWREMDSN
jgi:hypothetical protein